MATLIPLDGETEPEIESCDRCKGTGSLWNAYFARSFACEYCDGEGEWTVEPTCRLCGDPATCRLDATGEALCDSCAGDEIAALDSESTPERST